MRNTTNWVRFDWQLAHLGEPPEMPGYQFDRAVGADRNRLEEVVLEAYASDPIWNSIVDGIRRRMSARIDETLGSPGAAYMVALDDRVIVGVSGVARHHWSDQNLLTGLCVLPDHQRRGIGTRLLYESLRQLRAMGLETARVYTEEGSVADIRLYPKFGSVRTSGVQYPGVHESLT